MIPAIIAAAVAVAAAAASAGVAADTANKQKSIAEQAAEGYEDIPLSKYKSFNIGRYTPILQDLPTDISFEKLKRDPEMRQKFMDAIQTYLKMSDKSISTKGDLERAAAAMDADQNAAARSAAIRSEMAARGRGASGLEFGLADQENQAAANRRYLGGLTAANNAENERLNAFKAYTEALAQNEGVDLGLQEKNADIINRFNTLNAQRRDAINQRNVDLRNDASLKNIGLNQWDLMRGDTNENSLFGQRMAKQTGKANALNQKATAIGDEGANYAAAIGSLGKMAGQYLGYQYGANPDYADMQKRKVAGNS